MVFVLKVVGAVTLNAPFPISVQNWEEVDVRLLLGISCKMTWFVERMHCTFVRMSVLTCVWKTRAFWRGFCAGVAPVAVLSIKSRAGDGGCLPAFSRRVTKTQRSLTPLPRESV